MRKEKNRRIRAAVRTKGFAFKKLNLNTFKKIVIAVAVIIAFISVTLYLFYFYNSQKVIESRFLDVKFIIGDNPAFDVNTSILSFGKIPRGSTSIRRVSIENNYDFPIIVNIFSDKNINEFITSENEIELKPGEIVFVPFYVNIPDDAEYGEHQGKIVFKFYKKR